MRQKYTNEILAEIAKKYSNAKEWQENDKNTYQAAMRRNIYCEITKHFKPIRTYYSDQELFVIAQKYSCAKEWCEDDKNTYVVATNRKILLEITKHFQRKPGGFNPDLPGQFYQFKFKNQQVYNYGISNDYTKRYTRKDLDKMELLKVIEFKDGHECKKYETEIQEQFQKYRYNGVQLLSNKKNTELLTVDIFYPENTPSASLDIIKLSSSFSISV